jgi:hypothetical protein
MSSLCLLPLLLHNMNRGAHGHMRKSDVVKDRLAEIKVYPGVAFSLHCPREAMWDLYADVFEF